MMRKTMAFVGYLAAACAATPSLPQSVPANAQPILLENIQSGLAESCPADLEPTDPVAFGATLTGIDLGNETIPQDRMQGLDFAGIWHLERSGQPELGGISGLVEREEDGNLLAITDAAHWVSIAVDPVTRAPTGQVLLAPMRRADGTPMRGKGQGDSEGLDVEAGVALVSFEGNHRVSAFDLASCGFDAREVIVAQLAGDADGNALPTNRGPEGLALMADGTLTVGLEARSTGDVTFGTLRSDGTLGLVETRYAPAFHLQTGIDYRDGMTARVYRAYDPIRGPRIYFTVEAGDRVIASGTLKPPHPVDNVEGIAIGTGRQGRTRIWLVSDDNFSNDQRTLLFALDLTD